MTWLLLSSMFLYGALTNSLAQQTVLRWNPFCSVCSPSGVNVSLESLQLSHEIGLVMLKL